MKPLLFAIALAAALPVAEVALADRGRGGRDRARAGPVNVSREAALATAQNQGLARLRESKLRDGAWKFEGWNAAGVEIEVEVSASTGAVLKVETGPSRHGGRHR